MTTAKRLIAVVDIDGVLADPSHRQHHLDARPRDWDAFFAEVSGDVPIPEGISMLACLAVDHEIVLLSGRPERTRTDTVGWLERAAVPFDRLVLRRDSDRRPAGIMKAAALTRIGSPATVAVVVDDDADVIERVTGLGYRGRIFGLH